MVLEVVCLCREAVELVYDMSLCRFASKLSLIIAHSFQSNSSQLAHVDLTKLASLVRGLDKIRYDRVKIVRDAAVEAFSSFQQMNLAYLDGANLPPTSESHAQQECSNVLRPRSIQNLEPKAGYYNE